MAGAAIPLQDRERHVRREQLTMGLYVSITLLASLTFAAGAGTPGHGVLAIVWGTTVGLALAHWFAFSLAARLLDPEAEDPSVKEQLVAQLSAAMAVAVVASVPVLLLPEDYERLGARVATSACIGFVAYGESRNYGRPKRQSLGVAAGALGLGLLVAGVKHAIGH